MERHKEDNVLIIGQFLDQLKVLQKHFKAPIITGSTPVRERETLYKAFRTGEIKLLIVSKVANFAIDLPDANVAIQVSGTFGSRQEEAQRLGPHPAAQERREHHRTVLFARHPRHLRPGLQCQAAAVPHRTGLPLRDHRRG